MDRKAPYGRANTDSPLLIMNVLCEARSHGRRELGYEGHNGPIRIFEVPHSYLWRSVPLRGAAVGVHNAAPGRCGCPMGDSACPPAACGSKKGRRQALYPAPYGNSLYGNHREWAIPV